MAEEERVYAIRNEIRGWDGHGGRRDEFIRAAGH